MGYEMPPLMSHIPIQRGAKREEKPIAEGEGEAGEEGAPPQAAPMGMGLKPSDGAAEA